MTTEAQTPGASPAWVPSDMTFAMRLAMIRHQMGWNIKDAAKACGVPNTSWRLWELGGALPRNQVTIAKQIASAAGCSYVWLLEGPEGARPVEPTRRLRRDDRLVATVSPAPDSRPHGAVARTRPLSAVPIR